MQKERERRRTRIACFADSLPEEERKLLDEMLADVNIPYRVIAQTLTDRGYPIGKSAVGQYALRSGDALKRLRECRESAEALTKALKEGQDLQSAEVATGLLMDMLVQRLATAEDEMEGLPLEKVGELLVRLTRTTVYKQKYKDTRLKAIEQLESSIMEKIRSTVQSDDELLDRLMNLVTQAADAERKKDEA